MRRAPLALVLLLSGCAVGQFGSANTPKVIVRLGVVESITPIELDASSGAGSTLGSVFGQAGGANTGGGRGAVAGAVLGTVLGGTLGRQAGIATQPGLEIWVRLDDEGKSTYVMQPGKPDAFRIGEHVRVVRKNGEARVEPISGTATPDVPARPQ